MNIELLVEALGLTVNSFEKAIGVTQSRISKIIKRKSGVSHDILNKILSTFPEVNPDWLLRGEGEMFLDIHSRRMKFTAASGLRLLHLIVVLNIDKESFCKETGIHNISTLNLIGNGSADLPESADAALINNYNINPEWIRTGSGEVFVNQPDYTIKENRILRILQEISNSKYYDFMRFDVTVEILLGNLNYTVVEYLSRVLDFNILWLEKGEGEMFSGFKEYEAEVNKTPSEIEVQRVKLEIRKHSINMGFFETHELMKYVDLKKETEYKDLHNDSAYIDTLPETVFHVSPEILSEIRKNELKPTFRAFKIFGTEMEDNSNESIIDKDIIIGLRVNNLREKITLCESYLMVHKGGVFLRKIRSFDEQNNTIVCEAINSHRDIYPDLTVRLTDIKELYLVVKLERDLFV